VNEAPTILVVDDDPLQRELLARALTRHGYRANTTGDGAEALDCLAREPVALVLLDIIMPRLDGISVLKEIRGRARQLPVLVLSNDGAVDRCLEALRAGADDFLRKPLDPREIVARVEIVLRRAKSQRPSSMRLRFGATVVDLERRHATRRGAPLALTRTEYALLDFLAQNPDRPVSREQILAAVWGYTDGMRTRTVETHIWRLRKKLGDDADEPRWICNLSGIGYAMRCEFERDGEGSRARYP